MSNGVATTEFLTTTEIVQKAHSLLPPPVWDYVTGGAESETTIRRNREAINALAFRARVLRNVSSIDPSTSLLGARLRIPYILAPVGGLQQIVAGGAATAARAACAFGTLPVMSSVSAPPLEEVAAAATGDKWFQLYVRGDFDWIAEMVRRVRDAGFRVLVLTVDSAYYGNRERQLLRRWLPEGRRNHGGAEYQATLDWAMVDRIKAIAGLPIVLKGIQDSEDAVLALEHGIDGIWISNHGGRQLDHARGTLEVLPEVAEVVGGAVPILVDGGFLRGTDVVKALALGASAVATGRMYAWALGAGGEPGLQRMLEILEFEIKNTMGLIGVTRIEDLGPSYVTAAAPLSGGPHPFPFLEGGLLT